VTLRADGTQTLDPAVAAAVAGLANALAVLVLAWADRVRRTRRRRHRRPARDPEEDD